MKIIKIDKSEGLFGQVVAVELEGRINGKYVRPIYRMKTARDLSNVAEIEKALLLNVGDNYEASDYPTAKEML